MKTRWTVALSLLALTAMPALAQDKKPAGAPAMGAAEEAMMKAMAPGEQQKKLARFVGDWTFTNKAWMAPGQPPIEAAGTMHAESLMGGRYVEHTWKGNMMGMPFEGRGTEAYDNIGKMYVNSWVDNMGTGIMSRPGPVTRPSGTARTRGTCGIPMTGKKNTMK